MQTYSIRVALFLVVLFLLSCAEEEIRVNQNFGEGWKFTLTDQDIYRDPDFDDSSWRRLTLPHDWSIEGEFSKDHPATEGGGALPGGIGWYRKTFALNSKESARLFYIEFDGVYRNSEVWINGYYFLTDGEYVYHTDISNEEAIDPLKYATAEFMPDDSLGVAKTQDNKAVVFGRYSIEYFTDIASTNFAFRRLDTRAQKIGIVATHAKCEFGGSFYIVGGRKEEAISIHKIDLGSSTKIATREVDLLIEQYTESDLSDIRVECRKEGDIGIIQFNFPDFTLCFNTTMAAKYGLDLAWTVIKSDVAGDDNYKGINGVFDPRIAKWIYGDKTSATLGELDYTTAQHYGEDVEWILYTPFMYLETFSIDMIDFKTIPGFNIADDAQIALSATFDGISYSMEQWFTYSEPLEYDKRFIIYNLGHVPNFIGLKLRGVSSSRMSFATMGVTYS